MRICSRNELRGRGPFMEQKMSDESARVDVGIPLWIFGREQPTDATKFFDVLIPIQSERHGICALFFQDEEVAKREAVSQNVGYVLEIPNYACFLVLLEKMKNVGNEHIGVKRAGVGTSEKDEVSRVQYFKIDSVLNSVRFHFHLENP